MSMCKTGGARQVAISLLHNIRLFKNIHEIYLPEGLLEYVPNDLRERCLIGDNQLRLLFRLSKNEDWVIFNVFTPVYIQSRAFKVVTGFARPHLVYNTDLYYSTFAALERTRSKLKYTIIKSLIKRSTVDLYLCETDDVANRLKQLVQCDTLTVHNNVNPILLRNKIHSINRGDYDIRRILMVSSYYPHKRFELLDEIASLLKNKVTYKFKFIVTIESSELKKEVVNKDCFDFLGRISLEKLHTLYYESDVLIYPTLLECFSACWIESFFFGLPVVTSDIPSAKSVCGDAVHYSNPNNAESFSKGIAEILENCEYRNDLINRGKNRLMLFKKNRDKQISEVINNFVE